MDRISPLDDRYSRELADYASLVSEAALNRYRTIVELRFLEFLIDRLSRIGLIRPMNDEEKARLRKLRLSDDDMRRLRDLEDSLGHDIKALEYLLREKLRESGLGHYSHLVHLGLTSEDVNNLALSLMIKAVVHGKLLPSIIELIEELIKLVEAHANTPMLGRTHGQPAVPTTFGKEMAYHAYRLCWWSWDIINLRLQGKISGATGTLASFKLLGNLDWYLELRGFIEELGLEPASVSTQILPPDPLCRLLSSVGLMSMGLVNLAQDLWIYNMLGYIRVRGGLVGSSTMPHKVNPTDLENAEGNLKLAASILMEISKHLEISRLQRDLSDSTIKRNVGLGIGHVILAVRRLTRVIRNMEVNVDAMLRDLNEHWEVLSEAVQVRLRALGMVDAYEKALEVFRGSRLGGEEYRKILEELGVSDEELMRLTPVDYVGYAPKVALDTAKLCRGLLGEVMRRAREESRRLSEVLGRIFI